MQATLTAVSFRDENIGCIAGHDAVILRSDDGGERWSLVHADPGFEAPLLDIMLLEPERVTEKLRQSTFWQGRGGFIAGFYEDNVSIGLEPVWQEIACREFIKKGQAVSSRVGEDVLE